MEFCFFPFLLLFLNKDWRELDVTIKANKASVLEPRAGVKFCRLLIREMKSCVMCHR